MKKYLGILFIILGFVVQSALAENVGDERFNIIIGSFVADRNTNIRLDSKTLGLGTDINFEDVLNLEDETNTGRVEMWYRFGRRHRVEFGMYDLSRSATKQLTATIQYGDQVFSINTTIKTDADLNVWKLAYTYSFFLTDKTELSASGGLFVQDYNFKITDVGSGSAEAADATALLPVFGLRWNQKIGKKLYLKTGVQYFYTDQDDYEGRFQDSWIAIEHNTFKNTGFGISYNAIKMKIEATASNLTGRVDLDFDGWFLYAKFYF